MMLAAGRWRIAIDGLRLLMERPLMQRRLGKAVR
jgi:hypothetical protein